MKNVRRLKLVDPNDSYDDAKLMTPMRDLDGEVLDISWCDGLGDNKNRL